MNLDPKHPLAEKAVGAPTLMRVLFDAVRRQFRGEYPELDEDSRWKEFHALAIIGGCVALAVRLHNEVSSQLRTELELRMRSALQMPFAGSEHYFEDCSRFVTAGLLERQRTGRGKAVFPLIATWVITRTFEDDPLNEHAPLAAQLGMLYEQETEGYWPAEPTTDTDSPSSDVQQGTTAKDVAIMGAGAVGCLGIAAIHMVLSAIPIVLSVLFLLWLMQSCSS